MTKVNREVESNPRRYGKSTFVDNTFIASCEADKAVEYHHPKYVVLSRKAYENLSQTRNDLLREIMEEMPKIDYLALMIEWHESEQRQRQFVTADDYVIFKYRSALDQVNTLLESKLSTVKK